MKTAMNSKRPLTFDVGMTGGNTGQGRPTYYATLTDWQGKQVDRIDDEGIVATRAFMKNWLQFLKGYSK